MQNMEDVGQNIQWLRETHFSNPDRQIVLAAGEALLRPGQHNERLFLIVEGTLTGYIEDSSGDRFEIFRSGAGNLVGVYSFFAENHQSYSTVLAEERTVLAYLEHNHLHGARYGEFVKRILPIIVEEIYIRQLLAHRMSIENQQTMRRLHQAEKLATLGQMAAGLAHELNNAMGVILKKAEWLVERIAAYVQEKDTQGLYPFFQRGVREGQLLGTAEVRQRRREIERYLDLPTSLARDLAKVGFSDQDLQQHGDQIRQYADRIIEYYELGLALHDMLSAARHTSRVVHSVRELGAVARIHPVPTEVNRTVRDALTLLEELLHPVRLHVQLADSLPAITANPSDWVQVWVNIIKNAAEAMASAAMPNPELLVQSGRDNNHLWVAITDNGPGIPGELLEKIFQPNFTTKVEGLSFGLGLGLSIVQRIVETYHGTIEVESRPGRTTFTVKIPV